MRLLITLCASASLAALTGMTDAVAQSTDEIVVTGARTSGRTALLTPAPVDAFSERALQTTGAVSDELGQALAVLAPSFNFPRQSNSGTSDHIRAGQLRGLSPDQVLVLVNGKRRHTSAVVNTETKIGRGAAAVDLNTIPLSAVKRIEVLRDGAGAQYGSDAIAGVINIILDDAPTGGEASFGFGAHHTDVEAIDQTLTDGETYTAAADYGFALARGGFLRVGIDYENRNATNRAGFDQIPFFEAQTPANLALQGQRNYFEGDPETEDYNVWYNSELPVRFGTVYGFGTAGYRETSGGLFFRYPDSPQNVPEIFPNGFLPRTTGENLDFSLTSGLRFNALGFDLDASVTTGRNRFEYGVENSLNASFGPQSQTRFRSGTFELTQTTLNFDAARDLDLRVFSRPGRLALGAEYRREGFESEAGEPASFLAGPVTAPIGAQGAPGLTPQDEADENRDVGSVYAEFGQDVTDRLFVTVAGRYEHYSDVGGAATGKASALFRVTDALAVRGSVSNSFRAPSLAQVGLSDRTLNFGANRQQVLTRTVPAGDPLANALDVRELEEERSRNYTVGLTANPLPGLRFTVDAFRIEVDDRITLSERFFDAEGETAVADFLQSLPGGQDVASVRFFANAVDTETQGVDVVGSYERAIGAGAITFSVAYTYARTEIDRFAATPAPLLALNPEFRLVGVEEINTLEEAAPNDKAVVSVDWRGPKLDLLARVSFFGETTRVFNFGGGFEPSQTYGRETQLDLEGSYRVLDRLRLTLGAANVLDEYPDLSSGDINFFGNLPYDILSPVGVNGRYLYTRLAISY